MSSDNFTRNRFRWLEAIAKESALHSTALRVAVVIASHLNRQTGEAFPSIKTIAAKSATPERTVKHQISALCRTGYIEKRRGGFSRSNIYVMAGITTVDADQTPVLGEAMDCLSVAVTEAMDCLNGMSTEAMDCPAEGQRIAPRLGNGLPANPLKELLEKEPIEEDISIPPSGSLAHEGNGRPKAEGSEAEAAFVEFWEIYPRKDDKGKARRAWAKAIKIADTAVIIAGAKRYAEMRSGQDRQFTKLPASWLNAEAWENETLVALPHEAQPILIRNTAKDRTGAAILHMLSNDKEAP